MKNKRARVRVPKPGPIQQIREHMALMLASQQSFASDLNALARHLREQAQEVARVTRENASLCNRITIMRDLIERQKSEILHLARLQRPLDDKPPPINRPGGTPHG